MLETMKAITRDKDICVLATVSGDVPHCSLMAYVSDESCSEIYMATHRNTRKYKNLSANPTASLLIDTREEHRGASRPRAKALTIEGTFRVIVEEGKKKAVRARLLERHPHLKDFLDHPEAALLCLRIRSFLLLDGLTDAYFEEV
jgi:nitroimidazol reductase NimA-like FMN-containing flavoprotein (pyridoxamine 5'-phosphate oxidase superfamily)